MDPIFEEICRVRTPDGIRPSRLRDWQDYLRHSIQPKLDLLADLTRVEDEPAEAVQPVRRGPGRPRKEAP